MDTFMVILGILMSLIMIYFGLYFAIRPTKAVQSLQRMKYKEQGEPRKIEKTVSIIFGIILALIGLYFLGVSIVGISHL